MNWQEIPGWFDFDNLYDDAVARAPSSGAHLVEIGVLLGKSALYMASAIEKSGKQIEFDAVDTLVLGQDSLLDVASRYRHLHPDAATADVESLIRTRDHRGVVEKILETSDPSHLVKLVRSSGQVWAASYPTESLDFVFVDALHTYDDTASLLRAYLPKVRRGGILAGHDYDDKFPDVRRAVADVLGASNVTTSRLSFVYAKPA